ncbi:MAG TPA: hypothetical protein VNC50_01110, partial [Planctomycetia bacterium]|nr:hypothetical protein [Planctomycetia bacterium]
MTPAIFALLLLGQLKAGAAAVDITPGAGTPLAGYYHLRLSEGTLDPIFAKAMVLEDGETRAAIVTLDLITSPKLLVDEIRLEVERRTGIPGANVMVHATHAHTGPVLTSRGERNDLLGGAMDVSRRYAG